MAERWAYCQDCARWFYCLRNSGAVPTRPVCPVCLNESREVGVFEVVPEPGS